MKYLFALALTLALGACDSPENPATDTSLAQQYHGRWVVINYWAQWCKPCIAEIPELNALDEKYPQVAVLGVNYDGAVGDVLDKQLKTLGVAFPTLPQDPAAELGSPRPIVLPTTLILDPDGKLVHTLVGPQTLQSLALATEQAAIPEAGPTTEDLIDEQR